MKILLLSDTHGDLDKACRICSRLTGIDLILHCGDYLSDAYELEDLLGIPAVSVRGNCDGASGSARKTVETPAGRILLTHGHAEGVNLDFNRLLYLAEESDCIAACFGHTHRAFCENFNGIYLINPGSLPQPRDGSGGTCAVIRSTEDDFHVNILSYDRICGKDPGSGSGSSSTPVKGGFLRKLLNYSDRF